MNIHTGLWLLFVVAVGFLLQPCSKLPPTLELNHHLLHHDTGWVQLLEILDSIGKGFLSNCPLELPSVLLYSRAQNKVWMKCWLYSFKKDWLSMAGSRRYTRPYWYLGKQDPLPISRVYHPGRTYGQIIIKPVRSAMAVGSVQRASGRSILGYLSLPAGGWKVHQGRLLRGDSVWIGRWEDLRVGRHGWVGKWCEEKHIRQREECIDHKNKETWGSVYEFRLGTSVMMWKINKQLIIIRIWDSSLTMAASGRQDCSFCSQNTVSVHESQ